LSEEKQVLQILETCHAIIREGHFKLYGGNHSDGYVHVRLALGHSDYASRIGKKIADQFLNDKIEVVVGFTVGGIVLAEYVADFLRTRKAVARIWDDSVMFVGGSKIIPGENVLVVDDVLRPPAGEPINRILVKIKNEMKGNIKGVGVVVDRTLEEPNFVTDVKTIRLAKIKFLQLWSEPDCPLCKKGIPLEDLSKADIDPLTLLFSVSREEDRPFLAALLRHVFEEYWKDERILKELNSFYNPEQDFPGLRWERVAILGPTEGAGWDMMERIAKFVSSLGFYAITSRFIYQKHTAEKRILTHFKHEGLNEFLQKIIHECQYAIILHALPGGQLIENVWCNYSGKPTLGYIPVRDLSPDKLKACEYLDYIQEKNLFLCNGFRAIEEGREEIGGWVCKKNDKCPLISSQNIPKMIHDFFISGKRMFLVGSEGTGYEEPIRNFLQNKGMLKF